MSSASLDEEIQNEFGQLPALSPPPGVVSNLVNPPSRANLVVIGSAIILPVVAVFVIFRTYTKARISKSGLGREDYACLFSFAFFCVYNGLCLREIQFGDGVHQWNVTVINAMHFAQGANYLEIVYVPTIFFAKLSLLMSLLKLFAPIHRGTTYWLLHFTIFFNLLFYLAVMLVAVFACTPRAKIWDPLLPGKCVNPTAVLVATSAINSATDLFILVLPIVVVWKLQMSKSKKWGVSAIFFTGSFACLCSVMRFVNSVSLIGKTDLTYLLLDQGLWANGEAGSGLIAGCMLSAPQFFRQVTPRLASFLSARPKKSSNCAARDKLPDSTDTGSSGLATDVSGIRGDYIELEERGYTRASPFKKATATSRPVEDLHRAMS